MVTVASLEIFGRESELDADEAAPAAGHGHLGDHRAADRGAEAEAGKLIRGRLALGAVAENLEHLAVRLQVTAEELVVDSSRRLVIHAPLQNEEVVPVADLVVVEVV